MDIQIIWYLINIYLWKSWTSICICDLDVHVGNARLFVYQWFLVMSITHRHLIFHTSNYWECKCSIQNYWFNQNYEKYTPLLGIITRISYSIMQMFAFKTIFLVSFKIYQKSPKIIQCKYFSLLCDSFHQIKYMHWCVAEP